MPTADIRTWALTPENAPAELARQLTHSLLNEGVVDVAGGSYLVQRVGCWPETVDFPYDSTARYYNRG